jgi:uncharacterized protein YdcH (DUF465 family)
MLTETQKNHIRKHFAVLNKLNHSFNVKAREMRLLKDEYNSYDIKKYNEYDDEIDVFNVCIREYPDVLSKLTIKNQEKIQLIKSMEPLTETLIECSQRMRDLEKDYLDYLKKNNIDLEDRMMDETEYNLIHGITL